jgi:hypothetical protein
LNTIGELLFWLHGEVEDKGKSPTSLFIKEIADHLDMASSTNQHQRFSDPDLRPPNAILSGLMIREFESAAIVFEANCTEGTIPY